MMAGKPPKKDPTPKEIAELCRTIREDGHWEIHAHSHKRIWHAPWSVERLAMRWGSLPRAPYTVPEVSMDDLGPVTPFRRWSLASTLPDWYPDDGWVEVRKRREERTKMKTKVKGNR